MMLACEEPFRQISVAKFLFRLCPLFTKFLTFLFSWPSVAAYHSLCWTLFEDMDQNWVFTELGEAFICFSLKYNFEEKINTHLSHKL